MGAAYGKDKQRKSILESIQKSYKDLILVQRIQESVLGSYSGNASRWYELLRDIIYVIENPQPIDNPKEQAESTTAPKEEFVVDSEQEIEKENIQQVIDDIISIFDTTNDFDVFVKNVDDLSYKISTEDFDNIFRKARNSWFHLGKRYSLYNMYRVIDPVDLLTSPPKNGYRVQPIFKCLGILFQTDVLLE
jgi:hypothetical protein